MPNRKFKFKSLKDLESAKVKFKSKITSDILAWAKLFINNGKVEESDELYFYLFLRDNGYMFIRKGVWESELKKTKKNKILQNYEMVGMIAYAEIEDF